MIFTVGRLPAEARLPGKPTTGQMVALHGFVKKSQKAPAQDLETARKRLVRAQEQEDANP